MELSLDEFDEIRARIEELGGVLLDELCETRTHRFPDKELIALKEARGEDSTKSPFVYHANGCGNLTVFEIPYIKQKPSILDRLPLVSGKVKLCAVCDNIGLMPRFRKEL